MDLSFFRGETITIIRKTHLTTQDEYGLYKSTTEEVEVEGVVGVQATNLSKDLGNVVERTTLTVFFDFGTEIYPDDIFIIRGSVWEKNGNAFSDDNNVFASNLFAPPVKIQLAQVKGWAGQTPNTPESAQTVEEVEEGS